MELIFIRHGRPKVVAGDKDPVLTDAAQQQAEKLAMWLAHETIERIVASPLRRAFETAAPTSRKLRLDLEIIKGLAEVESSGVGYRGVEELRKDPAVWAKFMEDPISFLGGDPISFKQGVLAAVGALFDGTRNRKIAVFTHGLPINVVLSHALGLQRVMHFVPHYCSLTRVTGSSLQDMKIESVNETAHLDERAAAPAA